MSATKWTKERLGITDYIHIANPQKPGVRVRVTGSDPDAVCRAANQIEAHDALVEALRQADRTLPPHNQGGPRQWTDGCNCGGCMVRAALAQVEGK